MSSQTIFFSRTFADFVKFQNNSRISEMNLLFPMFSRMHDDDCDDDDD